MFSSSPEALTPSLVRREPRRPRRGTSEPPPTPIRGVVFDNAVDRRWYQADEESRRYLPIRATKPREPPVSHPVTASPRLGLGFPRPCPVEEEAVGAVDLQIDGNIPVRCTF
jgi:hypothetical protein